MIPPMGTIDVPYWEWWLHHNPFRIVYYYGPTNVDRHTCPICSSDTSCFSECPQRQIREKLAEIKKLMDDWRSRER